jgi:hypothetical protein
MATGRQWEARDRSRGRLRSPAGRAGQCCLSPGMVQRPEAVIAEIGAIIGEAPGCEPAIGSLCVMLMVV